MIAYLSSGEDCDMRGGVRGGRVWLRCLCVVAVGLPVVMAPTSPTSFARSDDEVPGEREISDSQSESEPLPSPDDVAVLESPPPVDVEPVVPDGRFGGPEPVREPVRVEELVDARTGSSDSWLNDDGSLTVTTYALPRYFQPVGSSEWVAIDTSVVPDNVEGRVRSKANEWSASFGGSTTPEGMQVFSLGTHTIAFSPVGALEVKPVAKESSVTYERLWPETDAVYTVSAIGVDEQLVLHTAAAPTRFEFDVAGATPRSNDEGGIDLLVGETVVATIPPLTVDTAKRSIPPSRAGAQFGVVATRGGEGGRVTIAISYDWLSSLPASEFPVVIDPTVFTTLSATSTTSYSSIGTTMSSLRAGRTYSSGIVWRARAYLPIPPLPGGGQPWHLVWAQIHGTYTGTPGFGVTMYGENLQPVSFASVVSAGQPLTTYQYVHGFETMVTDWIAQHPGPGAWFGLVGDEQSPQQTAVDLSSLSINYRYYQSPNPTSLQSPTGTVATTTPLLQAVPVTGETETVYYRFQIGTDPGAIGNVVDSGWNNSSSWQVPPGSLTDGATYYVKVWAGFFPYPTTDPRYVPPAEPTTITPITIKKRLGAGGPSPTDTVGAVPGSTQTPSEGAPSPGVSPASVTVNMLTGNLAVTLNTHALSTLSGAAAVSLSYDSLGSTGVDGGGRGLSGRYYTGSTLIGQRIDPTIDFNWPGSPMGGYLAPSSPVTGEWTGTIKAPAAVGAWHLGGKVSTGTMRIYLDGAATAYSTITATGPTFGPALSWAPNTSHSVKIEYTSNGARGVQLWALDDGVDPATTPAQFVVPSGWLTPNSTGMPTGWRLSANPYNGAWTRLDDLGSQVVVRSASGATATFTRRPDGSYTPPAGSSDLLSVAKATVAGVMAAGEFTLSNNAGLEIVFGGDGWVRSVRTLSDDRRPTALLYTYTAQPGTGSTPVLMQITDPVTGRSIGLCYGAALCDDPDSDYELSNAPAGMLARIGYWDGTFSSASYSTLVYDSYGRFIRLINPGGLMADFSYDPTGRLTGVRDPLAVDTIAMGQRSDCPNYASSTPTCMTQITYDPTAGKVTTVTQPAPTPGAARTSRTYTYSPNSVANTAQVSISGFNPTSGYATWVKWDSQGRIIEQKDSEQRVTRTIWHPTIDRVLSSIDPLSLQVANVYDQVTNLLTDSYGPAPASCFSTSSPYTPTGSCPITVPRTQHRYDEGINGLAATFWDNPYFAGGPKKHGTGPGGTGPTGPGCTVDTFCTQWNTLPVTPSGVTRPSLHDANHQFTWSMRLTGIIDVPTSFRILTATTQKVVVYLNDVVYTDVEPPTANLENIGSYGEWWLGTASYPPLMPAGKYRIQIDFLGSSTATLNGLFLTWDPGPGPGPYMSNSVLNPDYGLETTTIDPDNKTAATSYSNPANGIGPELGLVTAVTQDPAGLALTTTTTYESPASGRWLRKTASTLPADTTTTYKHYCSTPNSIDCATDQHADAVTTACGVSTFDTQHGLVAEQIDPAPNPSTSGRAQQFLYDRNGRIVGRRVGPAANIDTAPWQCTSYDIRGRVTSQTWPAVAGASARTITHSYMIGGNPLKNSVSDPNGTITSIVDLLGRVVSYTDTNNRTTTYLYDQAGRLTTITSPNSVTSHTFHPSSSKLATVQVTVGGQVHASAALGYDFLGRLSWISYNGGQMVGYVGYDVSGNQSSLVFEQDASPDPVRIAGHQISRSPGGRQIDSMIDTGAVNLVDPNPGGNNFVYDAAGRLITAHLFGGRSDYDYGGNVTGDNCTSYANGINPQPGKNTNRTGVTWTPTAASATITRSCFNAADQLVATIINGTPTSGYLYDGHGNQTNDGPDTYTWDSADRLAGITSGATAVSYLRDAVDRPIQRTENGTITRFGFNGFGDSADAVLNSAGSLVQQLHPLPGGVLVTIDQASLGKSWSYPNLNGHMIATSDNNGDLQASHAHYDPWGSQLAGNINNVTSNADLTAYGTHGKLQEHATNKPLILMGARPMSPTSGRFLTIDPIKGGCANDYTYGYGDPLNGADLTGMAWYDPSDWGIWGSIGGAFTSVAGFIDDHACVIGLTIVGTAILVGGFGAGAMILGTALGSAEMAAAGLSILQYTATSVAVAGAISVAAACVNANFGVECGETIAENYSSSPFVHVVDPDTGQITGMVWDVSQSTGSACPF